MPRKKTPGKQAAARRAAAPAAPDPSPLVTTIAEVALRLQVNERTVKSWLARGCPGEPGKYDTDAIRAWRSAVLGRGQEPSTNRAKWETRKAKAEALTKELLLRKRRAELIEVESACRLMARHAAEVKAHLEQIPDFAAAQVKLAAAAKKQLRERLKKKLHELCEVFSRGLAELATGDGE